MKKTNILRTEYLYRQIGPILTLVFSPTDGTTRLSSPISLPEAQNRAPTSFLLSRTHREGTRSRGRPRRAVSVLSPIPLNRTDEP